MSTVSNRELKEIERFCCETHQEKRDEPERNRHVHICSHWNLPNTWSLEGSNAHRSDKRVIRITPVAKFFRCNRTANRAPYRLNRVEIVAIWRPSALHAATPASLCPKGLGFSREIVAWDTPTAAAPGSGGISASAWSWSNE
jgi:hypothetical protein